MKIAVKSIASFLAKPAEGAAAALLYGPDAGLARERSQALVKRLLGDAPDALSILDISEARLLSDPAMLADELSAISFLSGNRVILIRDAGDKLTKILEAASEAMRADVYIIVLAGELGPRSSLRAWFEKAPHAASVPCYHDEARDIGDLLRDSFSQANISAGNDVIQYLLTQLGNDRYVTRQELEKILTYVGDEKTLTLQAAQLLTNYNQETDMDEAVNALADRNLAGLDKALTQLVKEGIQPVQYLRALSRYFLRLYAIKLQARNSSVESVISGLRPPVFFKQVPIITRHAKQWELESIARALSYITEAELSCKTSDLPVFAASERELFKATRL
ncbi:MAG: DNA polymerase III subunit delta [Alphaproteobacteria bacterium]|nr:DNA polymerase III subunit delta [Alphaproteobacteria bacterium]